MINMLDLAILNSLIEKGATARLKGLSIADLELEVNHWTARYHIKKLLQAGLIGKGIKDGGNASRYYATGEGQKTYEEVLS